MGRGRLYRSLSLLFLHIHFLCAAALLTALAVALAAGPGCTARSQGPLSVGRGQELPRVSAQAENSCMCPVSVCVWLSMWFPVCIVALRVIHM